ncbi:hypothetical protein CL655_00970 [bacterium]|nr:hypothetical protein [bacterium]
MVPGEPQELDSNVDPRYMIIRFSLVKSDRIRLIGAQNSLSGGVFGCGMLKRYKINSQKRMGMFTPQATSEHDAVARILTWVARLSLIGAVSFAPIMFIPVTSVPLLDGKLYIVAVLLCVALVVSALLVLRLGTLEVPTSATLAAGWLVFLAALVTAGLSGDVSDSLSSILGGTYTAGVIGVGIFTLTVMAITARHTATAVWVATLLLVTSAVLMFWHTLRLLLGFDLSFGLFPAQASSPLGSWSDVAILAAGLVLALLLSITHAGGRRWQRWAMLVALVAAVFVLLVINNTALWVLLGIISLSVVVMAITRRQSEPTPAFLAETKFGVSWLLVFAGVVFFGAMVVFLGGNTLQTWLANATDSSYVEVRPSVRASLDVVRGVWGEDALTGVGPGRYADAWRVHKSDTINQTIFWDTNFSSGHSFTLTQAAENGILGVAAWLLFMALLVISGVRTFLLTETVHKDVRYRLAQTSYVLAMFMWVSTFFANPSVTIFVLGCALTGLYIGLSFSIRPRQLFSLSLINNQRLSFVVVASLVLIMIAVIWVLQQMTEQLMAIAKQNQALTAGGTVEEISQQLAEAFALYQDDATARTDALLHTARVRQLLGVTEPTAEQQQAFQRSAVAAVRSSDTATQLDPTEPANWYTRVQAYSLLAQAEVEGALELAQAAAEEVRSRDPKSPQPDYIQAELALIAGDAATAREAASAAIQKKRDYTPALLLLAQIEINDGNVTDAITVTESVLSFEPSNPARWYQLGVLYQANNDLERAVAALSEAVRLDPDYANARYVRGLALAALGELDAARADLMRVQELNPGNEVVTAQLSQLDVAAAATSTPDALEPFDEAELDRTPESVSEAAAETDLVTTTTNTPEAVTTEE